MARSLLIKFSMLAVTAALIVWIGWPAPPPLQPDPNESIAPPNPTDTRGGTPADGLTTAGDRAETRHDRRVDLNRAGVNELEQLPGIGRILAQRVVDWRGAHGRFRSVEELTNVQGIGAKKLARIKPLVRVGAMTAPAAGRG